STNMESKAAAITAQTGPRAASTIPTGTKPAVFARKSYGPMLKRCKSAHGGGRSAIGTAVAARMIVSTGTLNPTINMRVNAEEHQIDPLRGRKRDGHLCTQDHGQHWNSKSDNLEVLRPSRLSTNDPRSPDRSSSMVRSPSRSPERLTR